MGLTGVAKFDGWIKHVASDPEEIVDLEEERESQAAEAGSTDTPADASMAAAAAQQEPSTPQTSEAGALDTSEQAIQASAEGGEGTETPQPVLELELPSRFSSRNIPEPPEGAAAAVAQAGNVAAGTDRDVIGPQQDVQTLLTRAQVATGNGECTCCVACDLSGGACRAPRAAGPVAVDSRSRHPHVRCDESGVRHPQTLRSGPNHVSSSPRPGCLCSTGGCRRS